MDSKEKGRQYCDIFPLGAIAVLVATLLYVHGYFFSEGPFHKYYCFNMIKAHLAFVLFALFCDLPGYIVLLRKKPKD